MGLALLPTVAIWCVVAGGMFLAARWAAEELAEALMPGTRYVLGGVLLALAALGPVQVWSRWTLAIPGSPVSVVAASGLAWIALLAAGSGKIRGWVAALIFAICVAPVGFFGAIWLLFQPSHDLRGRISPTLTYEITSTQAWGGGRGYNYVVYRNPAALPFVRRKAGEGATPCDPSDVVFDPWRFTAGRDERTVEVECDVDRGRKVERHEVAIQ